MKQKKRTHKLTREQLANMKEHFSELTAEEWAKEYNVKRYAICYWSYRWGLRPHAERNSPGNRRPKPYKLTEERLAYMKEHFSELTAEEWAKTYGVTKSLIFHYGLRWGLHTCRLRKLTKTQLDRIMSHYREKTPTEWAKEYGVTSSLISTYARKNGMRILSESSEKKEWTATKPIGRIEKRGISSLEVDGIGYEATTSGGCDECDLRDVCLNVNGMSEVGRLCLSLRMSGDEWMNASFKKIETETIKE